MSDILRKLRHLQKEPVNRNELPSNASGREGDIVHYTNKTNFNKVEQYIKKGGEWINLLSGRPLKDSEKTRRFIKIKES